MVLKALPSRPASHMSVRTHTRTPHPQTALTSPLLSFPNSHSCLTYSVAFSNPQDICSVKTSISPFPCTCVSCKAQFLFVSIVFDLTSVLWNFLRPDSPCEAANTADGLLLTGVCFGRRNVHGAQPAAHEPSSCFTPKKGGVRERLLPATSRSYEALDPSPNIVRCPQTQKGGLGTGE